MTIPEDLIINILNYISFKNRIKYIILNKSIYNYILNDKFIISFIEINNISIPQQFKNNMIYKTHKVLSKIYRLCDVCNIKFGSYKDLFYKRICIDCNDSPQYKLITKTNAKKIYKLNEKILDTLECIKTKNPHYKTGSQMTLYREVDVKNKSKQLYPHLCINIEI